MKRFFGVVLLFVTGLSFFIACNKSDNTPKQCTAAPSTAQAPSDGLANYYVSSTDPTAKISSITYQGTNGPISLPGPLILPWNTSVFVKNGTTMSIAAVGSGGGKLTAGYSFNNGTDSVSNYSSCSN
jgi:hypothetical protein